VQDAVFVGACPEPFEYSHLLSVGKTPAVRHVEKERNPRADLVYILAARASTARGLENKVIVRNKNAVFNLNQCNVSNPLLSLRLPSCVILSPACVIPTEAEESIKTPWRSHSTTKNLKLKTQN
jgi:hypothetical protein